MKVYVILLTAPPSRLEIVDNKNNAVWNSTSPPVMEDNPLEITCKAYDGMSKLLLLKRKRGTAKNSENPNAKMSDDASVCDL